MRHRPHRLHRPHRCCLLQAVCREGEAGGEVGKVRLQTTHPATRKARGSSAPPSSSSPSSPSLSLVAAPHMRTAAALASLAGRGVGLCDAEGLLELPLVGPEASRVGLKDMSHCSLSDQGPGRGEARTVQLTDSVDREKRTEIIRARYPGFPLPRKLRAAGTLPPIRCASSQQAQAPRNMTWKKRIQRRQCTLHFTFHFT